MFQYNSSQFITSPYLTRHRQNPILAPKDVPYGPAMVFNAGVAKYEGQYVMVFRNDYGNEALGVVDPHHTTNLGVAFSSDGVNWNVQSTPCWMWHDDEVIRIYDPRLTVIDGRCYMCFAVDTQHGLRGGVAVTEDFQHFEVLSLSLPDNRNMVLFPDRIHDSFVRLERPMPVYSRGGKDRFDTWISDSPDLAYWGNPKLLLAVEQVPFANDKVGPGAPPILTEKGYLTTFHAVDIDPSRGKNGWEPSWKKRYSTGLMLLDKDDPSKLLGIAPYPLLVPEAAYEVDGGFRNHVVFPGGMILEPSGEVKIYYGAADTVECLATADVDDLLKLVLEGDGRERHGHEGGYQR